MIYGIDIEELRFLQVISLGTDICVQFTSNQG